jgi:hypothetical protein
MMKTIRSYQSLLLATTVLSLAFLTPSADGRDMIQYGDAGIIMSMRQKFITDYKDTFNFEFMQDIQSTYFPQVEKVFPMGLVNMYFKMYDIKIVEAKYQANNTNLLIS